MITKGDVRKGIGRPGSPGANRDTPFKTPDSVVKSRDLKKFEQLKDFHYFCSISIGKPFHIFNRTNRCLQDFSITSNIKLCISKNKQLTQSFIV